LAEHLDSSFGVIMTFARPTLSQLISRARSDIQTRLPGADAGLRRSVEDVLARVSGGMAHSLHGHLVWLSKQLMPDTAEQEFATRWADIYGLTRVSATKATGSISLTGTTGTLCPDGTEWQTADGVLYIQDGDVTLAAGTGTATVEADVGGVNGNQIVGVKLTLVTPIAGINSEATIGGSGLTGGADEETDAALLSRTLLRIQNPPKGGGPTDYEQWALEVAGVTRAWEYPNLDGLGTVGVYFVRDNDSPITPDPTEIATMQTYLDAKAPVTANVNVYAPTLQDINFHIHINSYTGSLTDVKAAIIAELEDLIYRVGTTDGMTVYLSQINEAISLATGEVDHTTVAPAADVVVPIGSLANMGTMTW
jgi:uncharacterized phage protein gp47/JayE